MGSSQSLTARRSTPSDPPYVRIKKYIVERVSEGEWTDGTRLPSEHELMKLFRVSRMTVHRALRELSAEGVLSRVQGVGTFLAPPDARSEYFRVQSIAKDIVSRGHKHRSELITLEEIRADADLAMAFDLR